MNEKSYLGDGVYAELSIGMIALTAYRDNGQAHVIYLQPEIYAALVAWVKRLEDKTK